MLAPYVLQWDHRSMPSTNTNFDDRRGLDEQMAELAQTLDSLRSLDAALDAVTLSALSAVEGAEFANITATHGRKMNPTAKTKVYQPQGWITTARIRHARRIAIVMTYCFMRAVSSSPGAASRDVAEGVSRLRIFTLPV